MIVAVDFDGVLVQDCFPGVGQHDYQMMELVREVALAGHEVILWTSRVGERLRDAVNACDEHNIHFTSVNGGSPNNLKQYGTDPRKVYADVYIDDRALGYSRINTIEFLRKLTNKEGKHE